MTCLWSALVGAPANSAVEPTAPLRVAAAHRQGRYADRR